MISSSMDYEKAESFVFEKLNSGLGPELSYHGVHHTKDVLEAVIALAKAEHVSDYETVLIKSAALFHDIGFTEKYKDHEEAGCVIAKEYLPGFGYNEEQTAQICGMIMATKIPQTPHNLLEEILCDADLDYLGREDFYPISHSLFLEFMNNGSIAGKKEWDKLQVKFFESHHYFTKTAKAIRLPEKNKRLAELKKIAEDNRP
jgi:uncharacterized protein